MRRLLAGLVTLAAVVGMPEPVSTQSIGVVLMHGNTDSPSGSIALLAAAGRAAGDVLVASAHARPAVPRVLG